MSEVLAFLRPGDPEALPGAWLELGFTGVVCGVEALPEPAATAREVGLDLVALLDPEGDGGALEPRAREAGAWMVWSRSGESPYRRLGSAAEVEAFRAEADPPEGVLWADEAGEDPGEDADGALVELVSLLGELGFQGGVALRARDLERLEALRSLVSEALAEGASWWDGSEDGY